MRPLSNPLWARQLDGYICGGCTRQLNRQKRPYATSRLRHEVYDVVCVGGGPAGLSLIAALRTLFYSLINPRQQLIDTLEQVRIRQLPV
jgi:ubiquinone biosynthesis monooxygenase Coq6